VRPRLSGKAVQRCTANHPFNYQRPVEPHALSEVADEHRIARSTLQDALERLLADERNVRRNDQDRPFVLDPLFGEWLRRR
jgi:hypothetical protein